MSCIGCKNFYYSSDGNGQCYMPYKEAYLENNFQFKENILDIFLRENLEGTPPPPFLF